MIKQKDVIRLQVPYPSISSDLAVQAHMYVCKAYTSECCELVKCQTLKPSIIKCLKHYCIEKSDINRNPFVHTTLIDCDKAFQLSDIALDASLRTTRRPDVCDELFGEIVQELLEDGFENIELDKDKLLSLNYALK